MSLKAAAFLSFGGVRLLLQRTVQLPSHSSLICSRAASSKAAGTGISITSKYKFGYNDIPEMENSPEAVKKRFSIEFASKKQRNKLLKNEMIQKYQQNPGDTGSTAVQIAIMTAKIQNLTEHMRNNRKDKSSLRKLLHGIERRKKLFKYLRRTDFTRYHVLLKEFGLKPLVDDKYATLDKKNKK
ncbi:PREDICTED: 28S ribosomal protein S15, mitochondrial-like [Amphimedon queenslandica]|uniref:30S ribosomal protein S15 n=1 Tax=Amphimedon queenslandica TaxID=400682 RepID=A0A1X7VMX5_AMPQE|nr:PREDICTED: 28S ribosomal protein S15, mitochondrial-like [Amphimedon queenslandica]|eukprot:XP_011409735.1 PREDICTED: 28S ribosomal protein S15, mitochondrial-like [Amphimedon queenslandica]